MESIRALRIYSGATAIVTGSASGSGRGFAEELAKCGCETVLADIQDELAEDLASGIRVRESKATAIKRT